MHVRSLIGWLWARRTQPWARATGTLLLSVLVAAASHVGCQMRQLDVTFDAQSLTIENLETMKAGTGDEVAVRGEFLEQVSEVRLFQTRRKTVASSEGTPVAGGAERGTAPDEQWAIDSGSPSGALFIGPSSGTSCRGIRLQTSSTTGDKLPAISLHIEDTDPGCTVSMRWSSQHVDRELKGGAHLEFAMRPSAIVAQGATDSAPSVVIIEGLAAEGLSAALRGPLDGMDGPYTCRKGNRFALRGWGVEMASVRLAGSPKDPVLKAWARAFRVSRFNVDGSRCVLGLYIPTGPQGLFPWVVFASVFGFLWKGWGCRENRPG